jgi:hypothetical protein
MLVHCARWTAGRDLILEVIGPPDNRQSVRQKDNIRRFLGYGAVEGGVVLDCASDRATLWAVGRLLSDQSHTFSTPLAQAMSGKAQPHEISATVAWFAPPRVGAAAYRGVQMKLIEPKDSVGTFAVSAPSDQPDANQIHNGTVIHRRWTGSKAAALGPNSSFELMIQRQIDDHVDPTDYAIVVSVAMAGVEEVYNQIRDRVAIKPLIQVVA